jgi:signal transduction histidine kinase
MAKSAKTQARSALAQGFVVPIIGAVVALLLGLMIVDITHTNLDIWVWVLIHLILGFGFIWGTHAATKSFNFDLAHNVANGAAKGARNLNLVLGIIWSAIVTLMSFAKGGEAVSSLVDYNYPSVPVMDGGYSGPVIKALTATWWLEEFLPALVLIIIAAVGIYLLLLERSREPKN